jgi:transcriptional regulator with AAA-type ATPase domain/ferredoxin
MKSAHDNIVPIGVLPQILKGLSSKDCVLETHNEGEHIVGPGKRGDEIIFILSGAASLYLKDSHASPQLIDHLVQGDLFGEVGFFTNSPWPSDAELVTDTPCEILTVPSETFVSWLNDHPEIVIPLVKKLVRKIIHLNHSLLGSNNQRQALQKVISREEHVFPDYVMGEFVRKRVHGRLEELAETDGPVLIIGESGVGKEGLAHLVYRLSDHCKEIFLPLDLKQWTAQQELEDPSLDREIRENALTRVQERLFFGIEEKGPSGGVSFSPGYFELTHGGTLLVRGVDTLTRTMQMKLLEAMVTQTFRRHGGVRLYKSHVRLIGATRLDPSQISAERHPLIYAMLERSVALPALRNRRREIPGLVNRYLSNYVRDLGKSPKTVPENTMRVLVNYSWPGNDLELASTLKRAILVSDQDTITPQDIHFGMRKPEGRGKINLLGMGFLKRIITSQWYPRALQILAAPLFLAALVILLLGPENPSANPAALVSWTVGWPMMILGAFFLARFWCSACPIGFLSELSQKLVCLNIQAPQFLKNHAMSLMAVAIFLIVWFEASFNIRESPATLGIFLAAMLISAIAASMIFQGRTWCRRLCALGAMTGVLAKASILELRMDRNVCISQCGAFDCLQGGPDREGCPFGLTGPRLESNSMCKLCGNCVKNCKHGAININLRPPASELWNARAPQAGVALMAIAMLCALIAETMLKTSIFEDLHVRAGLSDFWAVTLVFAGTALTVNLVGLITAWISKSITKETLQENYATYGPALIPFTLSAFAAFHLYYMLHLGPALIELFPASGGVSEWLSSILTRDTIYDLQRLILIIGLLWTMITLFLISRTGHDSPLRGALSGLPHGLLSIILFSLVLFGIFNLTY